MQKQRKRTYRPEIASLSIPEKANKVLHIILIALFLILLRVWHLTIVQTEAREEEAKRPQIRTVVEPAKRGTIRDRYNLPLAINKIQYNASIMYAQIRQIPSITWEKNEQGSKVKIFKRRKYIQDLAEVLGRELGLDPGRVEDLVHSKASFHPHVPFVIKEDISEQEYYRLKMLSKDWLGLSVSHHPQRVYPQGKVAGDLIGYMGAINKQEYHAILDQMRELEEYVTLVEYGEDPPLPSGISRVGEARDRLRQLKQKAYTINDYVGKSGIEAKFEDILRGFHGERHYQADAKGNFLRELSGTRPPLSGQRILLTISAELQKYAEELLIQNENIRKARLSNTKGARITLPDDKQPWIKGGAIVAMDPLTGDIVALASYPRIDPNDFIPGGNTTENKRKKSNINKWFENETYLGELWDQMRPLEREVYDHNKEIYENQEKLLSWEEYLNLVLSKESSIRQHISRVERVRDAVELQKSVELLLKTSEENDLHRFLNAFYVNEPHVVYHQKLAPSQREAIEKKIKSSGAPIVASLNRLDYFVGGIPYQYDKILLIDLTRLAVDHSRISQELLVEIGDHPIASYRSANAAKAILNKHAKIVAKDMFHDTLFAQWRRDNEKAYLKTMREQEKTEKKFPKPYLDYIDAKENELFENYWQEHSIALMTLLLEGGNTIPTDEIGNLFMDWHREIEAGAHKNAEWKRAYTILKGVLHPLPAPLKAQYLGSLRSYEELNRPLYGKYRGLRHTNRQQLEKHLAGAFYPLNGYGYGRSYAYRQAATQGSIFKLVTAHEGLLQHYKTLNLPYPSKTLLNPLQITDTFFRSGQDIYLGYHADGKPIPRHYKGGRLPKTAAQAVGQLDIVKAIEVSSNVYFALLAGDVLEHPHDLADAARKFSYGNRTGIDLPGEIRGNVPNDLDTNPTGLYSTAIGQHTLVVTPLQSAVMLSTIANKGAVLKPKLIYLTAGRLPNFGEDLDHFPPHFRFHECLSLCGINFPLFTAVAIQDPKSMVHIQEPEVVRQVEMPTRIRNIILEGMHRVVVRSNQESLGALSHVYRDYPEAISDYVELKDQLIGKTSTAESMERIDLDLEKGVNMFTHVWFGGIALENPLHSYSYTSEDAFGNPELVVIVYLRYGGYGKEAAPVAAQIAKKWREITRHRHDNHGLKH